MGGIALEGIALFIGFLVVFIFVVQILIDRSLRTIKEEYEMKTKELEDRIEKLEKRNN
jgi:predicted Holliday junction resolvase-like endonuclease